MITEIKVAGVAYPITYKHDSDMENYLGYTNLTIPGIAINDLYSKDIQQSTLLHEIVHAVSYQYGSQLTEQQVESISRGLYTVLKDNPNYKIIEP